ncbi:MAG: sulfatase [Armatimonadota bacterium]
MSEQISRRKFLQAGAMGLMGMMVQGQQKAPAVQLRRPPNLLFIHVDQMFCDAISAHGCKFVKTPNIDRLIARGISFRLSYAANPVCCPARSAWYTGRATSETGVVRNDYPIVKDLPDLGQWFRARGYEAVYVGKWHVPGRDVTKSFTVLPAGHWCGQHADGAIARTAASFLLNYRGDKPFFLSVGFLQPHDCCYWVFAHRQPLDKLPFPEIADQLPPIWENFGYDPREPETFQRGWRRGWEWGQISQWSEEQWRYYRWSYLRMVEMVDAQVGHILDALEDSGLDKNTVVVFSSDHGDGMGAHKLWQKMYFYEEAARVPFIVSWKGQFAEGVIDEKHLVSGLDLAPTLCDLAGIDAPPKCRGLSLRPLLEGKDVQWREFLVSEVNITGRMVRTPEWKLITYYGDQTDQLFDMRNDKGEMKNLAMEGKYAEVVTDLKKLLADWEKRLEPAPIKS